MITNLWIWSRAHAETQACEPHSALISITDILRPPVELCPDAVWSSVLRLSFADVQNRDSDRRGFLPKDAHAILDWIDTLDETVTGIYVQCEGGISRSAAIVKALAEHWSIPCDEGLVRFHNERVYQVLREAIASRTS